MKIATLILIIILGFLLRLAYVTQVPPHLSNDEISIAFDAYSLLKTGRDEHNHPLPISFESHGDYKAPVYHYLLVLPTLIFGNSPLTAKLPSVILGSLTILIIFYLCLLITNNYKLGLLASAILALSPWHIYTSHMVLETNVALFFLSLGLYLLLSNKLYSLSPIFLSLSMYSYHTEFGLVPLLILGKLSKKFLIIFFILTSPLFFNYFAHLGTSARANVEVIWNDPGVKTPAQITSVFISNYFTYLNPGYLFFTGLGLFPQSHPYQSGLFLWPLCLPFFIGIFRAKKHIRPKYYLFFIYWTLVSPVIPALTHGGNSLLRNLVSILPYSILIAIGLYHLLRQFKPLYLSITTLSLTVFILFYSVFIFHFPGVTAASYQGYRPIAEYISRHPGQYSHLVVDDHYGIDNQFSGIPELYFGYYQKLNPSYFQHRQYTKTGINYGPDLTISTIKWGQFSLSKDTWYIVSVGNPPPSGLITNNLKLITSIPDAGGRHAFEIWSTKN